MFLLIKYQNKLNYKQWIIENLAPINSLFLGNLQTLIDELFHLLADDGLLVELHNNRIALIHFNQFLLIVARERKPAKKYQL
jgi:hypothetical protein